MKIHGAKPRSDPAIIKERLGQLAEAYSILQDVLHKMDGSSPGNPYGGREMAVAATYLDTSYLWAKEAVEQS